MVALAAQALLLLGALQIQVVLAPDQPVPYVYGGEPLIIELVSTRDTICTLTVEILSPEGPDQTLAPEQSIRLLANRPRWIAVGELPPYNGPHTVRTRVDEDGVVTERVSTVHRVERTTVTKAFPFTVSTDSLSEKLIWTLRSLPAGTLRLDASVPEFREDAKRARAELGWRIHLRVDDALVSGESTLEEYVRSLSGYVDAWEVASPQGPSRTLEMARSIRNASPNAAVHAIVDDPQALRNLLELDVEGAIVGAVADVSSTALLAYGRAAERAGFEGYPLRATRSPAVHDQRGAYPIVRGLIASRADHGDATIGGDALHGDSGMGPAYDEVYAALRILAGTRYAGNLSLEEGMHVELFRVWDRVSGGESWIAALWSDDPADSPIQIPVKGAKDLELLDAYGNQVALESKKRDAVSIKSKGAVQYLRGRGGPILDRIAAHYVRTQSETLLAKPEFAPHLDEESIRALRNLARYEMGAKIRSDFLMLLRSMPVIEWQWHQGSIETHIATPLLARLAELVRYAAVLEHRSGETFLEPLEITLAKCADYQRRVAPDVGHGVDTRAQWLKMEVSRLVREARDLAVFGRTIEANAVAAIAEWRARCLEVAAAAPPRRNADAGPEVE